MNDNDRKTAVSVTKLNNYINNYINDDFFLSSITVKGEVQRVNYNKTLGHIYFDIKDESSSISCVIFKNVAETITTTFEQGMSIIAKGKISYYKGTGKLSFIINDIEETGIGDLFQKFIELKNELEETGMFSPIYKKPIPKYINKLGIVTAADMAAVNDIVRTAKNNNPYIEIVLSPTLVQGDKAKFEIPKAIKRLEKEKPDVIILGRGGGSIKDLWAFNEREVVEAIFDCEIPIVTGIGHDIDTTLSDYVADYYAITPTAAAEKCVYNYYDFIDLLTDYKEKMTNVITDKIDDYKLNIKYNKKIIESRKPFNRVETYKALLDNKSQSISDNLKDKITDTIINLEEYKNSYRNAVKYRLKDNKAELDLLVTKIEALSPLNKLKSGYSYIETDNKVLTNISQVKKNSILKIFVTDGIIKSNVIEKNKIDRG